MTVSCPRKLEFLDWLVLKATGCGGKEEKYPPPPGMERDCLVPLHHTNCDLFCSYIICDWCSVIISIMLQFSYVI